MFVTPARHVTCRPPGKCKAARYADAPGTLCAPPFTLSCTCAQQLSPQNRALGPLFPLPFSLPRKVLAHLCQSSHCSEPPGPWQSPGRVGLVPSSGMDPEHCQERTQTSGGRLEALAPQGCLWAAYRPHLSHSPLLTGEGWWGHSSWVKGVSRTVAQAN